MRKGAMDSEPSEALLKAAILQYSMDELKGYPSLEELDKLQISDICDHEIRNMIKRFWRRQYLSQCLRKIGKTAAVIIMTAGISFMVLLQFKEVRAACYNIWVQVTNRYIQFDYNALDEELETVTLGYIPEGFYEVGKDKLAGMYVLDYENAGGEELNLTYYKSGTSNLDNEHYDITDVTVNGSSGQYFSSRDEKFMNMLIWYNDKGCFIISSTLNQNEILKVAENIK